jgi:hypothetical protein
MNLFKLCAIVVIASSLVAVVVNFTSNPRAALYASLTATWAFIAMVKDE